MRALLAAALLTVAFSAFGHGGEDHGAPPPVLSQSVAPRASAATDEFEVVVVLEERQLVIYVDGFASNAPVAGAKVEIDGLGSQGAVARETAPGTYAIGLPAELPADKYPLTISIETKDSADLLSATLDSTRPTSSEGHVHAWSEWSVWTLAAVLLVASGALLLARRKRKAK